MSDVKCELISVVFQDYCALTGKQQFTAHFPVPNLLIFKDSFKTLELFWIITVWTLYLVILLCIEINCDDKNALQGLKLVLDRKNK